METGSITRLDILQNAKKYHSNYRGLCQAIASSAYVLLYDEENKGEAYYYYPNEGPQKIIPLLTKNNAKPFGAVGLAYWWREYVWDTGRLDFLNWLIEQYKDDTEDITEDLAEFIHLKFIA